MEPTIQYILAITVLFAVVMTAYLVLLYLRPSTQVDLHQVVDIAQAVAQLAEMDEIEEEKEESEEEEGSLNTSGLEPTSTLTLRRKTRSSSK